MQRLIRWTLILIAVVAVAIVIGLYGAVHYINSDKFKEDLVLKVKEETGRELSIDGDLEFSVYPWAGVKVNQVTLANAAGFEGDAFFKADQIAVRIKTMPLLKQQYELDTFKLHGMQLNLARNQQGVSNWDDLVKPKPEQEAKGEMPELSAIVLGGVDIQQGQINWRDDQSGQILKVQDLQANTGELTYGAPVELSVSMKTEMNQPAIKKDIKLKGTLNYDLDNEVYSISPLTIDSVVTGKNVPGGSASSTLSTAIEMNMKAETASVKDLKISVLDTLLSANLNASDVQSGKPSVNGSLELAGADLSKLVKVLEIEPLASDLAKLKDRSFEVKTELQANMDEDTLSVPMLSVRGLGNQIDANLDVRELQSATPSARGQLNAKGDDLPLLLQLLSPFMGGDAEQISSIGKKLSADGGKGFNVSTEFDADMSNGKITVPKLSATLPGATINGQLNADKIRSDEPQVKGELKVDGKNISSLLQILAGMKGGDADAMTKSLSGLKDKSFNVDAVFDSGKEAGSVELSKLNISGLETKVDSSITIGNLKANAPSIKGKLATSGNNMPLLLKVIGALQPEGAGIISLGNDLGKTGSKTFSVNSEINADLDKGAIQVPALSAKLLGAVIEGNVTASGTNTDAPSVKGQLKASGSDLPSLLRLVGNLQGADSGLGASGKKLSGMKKKSFVADVAFDANQQAGDINVSKLSAQALGLDINGSLKAKGFKGNKGNIEGRLSVSGNELSDLLTAYDQKDLAGVLKEVKLDAGITGSGGAMEFKPFSMKATLSGKDIPNSPVDLSLTGDVSANLDKQTLNIKNLSLKGLGLDASGNVDATKIQEAPEFKGTLTVVPFNLREFMKTLKQKPPVTADPDVLKKVSFSSQFSGSANSIAFKELSMGLDDSQIKGEASVINFAKPAITFGVGINQINLDRYMPPVEKGKKAKPATPETAAAGAAQLPVETLRSLDIDGKLLIGSVIYSNLKLNNVKLALNAKDGKIKLNPAQAELYQGAYDGSVALDATGKFPKLTLNTNLKGVQIEPLLKDFQGEANLKGSSDINLALFSAGSDVNTLKRNLNGQGGLKITNGVFQGVDVRRVLQEVEIMIENKVPGKPTEGGETAFDRMTASLDIKSGVVNNKDLLLTSPGIKVTGNGMLANLNDETWKYNLTLAVDETTATSKDSRYNIGGYSIPVQCRGLIKDKRCVPDVGDVLTTILKKSVTDKLLEGVGVKKKKSGGSAPAGSKEKAIDPGSILEEGLKGLFD